LTGERLPRTTPGSVPRCLVVDAAPPNHRIRLDFRGEFHVETSKDCAYDYLQVVDGPFGYSPVVGQFCGRRQPSLIESTGRYLWLRFHSDDSIEYVGFHVVYEFIPAATDEQHTSPGSYTRLAAVVRRTVIACICRYLTDWQRYNIITIIITRKPRAGA